MIRIYRVGIKSSMAVHDKGWHKIYNHHDKVTRLQSLSSYIAVSCGVVKDRYDTPIEDHIL